MEADWEVEIGGGAPVIQAHWPGFIDLRAYPDRIWEIAEARKFQPLVDLLLRLNSDRSPMWTSKCDVWQPEPCGLACYVDLLPRDGRVFADWKRAEAFCRDLLAKVVPLVSPTGKAEPGGRAVLVEGRIGGPEASVTLVVRQAVTEHAEGFGITAYFGADQPRSADAEKCLAEVMTIFADAIAGTTFTEGTVQS